MTHKERTCEAIHHRQPDRVPIEYWARDEVTEALVHRLGLESPSELMDALDIDLRGVGPKFIPASHSLSYADPTIEVTPEGIHRDIWGVGFRPNQTSCGFYMDLASSPLHSISSVDELADHSWPSPDLWDYSEIGRQTESLSEFWIGAHSRGIFEISWFLRGFAEFMTDLVCERDLAVALMDRVQEYLFERTRRVLEAGKGKIDMVEYNDDVGGQDALLIAPGLWREHLKPRMAEFVRLCRTHGAVVRYHSCGSVRAVIPDLIEIGVDVLNPVQAIAAGMDPYELKKEYGGLITLDGCVDTQQLLPNATADEVRREVARLIEIVGNGGGLILAPSHVLQPDVPVENVVALYETALGRNLV